MRFLLYMLFLFSGPSLLGVEDASLLDVWRQKGVNLITTDFSHPKLRPYAKYAKALNDNSRSTGILLKCDSK